MCTIGCYFQLHSILEGCIHTVKSGCSLTSDFVNLIAIIWRNVYDCRMKEERLKKKSEGASEVMTWVSKSRKIEEKRTAEKERALQLSKIFEEQVCWCACDSFSVEIGLMWPQVFMIYYGVIFAGQNKWRRKRWRGESSASCKYGSSFWIYLLVNLSNQLC